MSFEEDPSFRSSSSLRNLDFACGLVCYTCNIACSRIRKNTAEALVSRRCKAKGPLSDWGTYEGICK